FLKLKKFFFMSIVIILSVLITSPVGVVAESEDENYEYEEQESNEYTEMENHNEENNIENELNNKEQLEDQRETNIEKKEISNIEQLTSDDKENTYETKKVDSDSLIEGNSSEEIKKFKEDLTTAGFTPWTTPNDYYGPETVEHVKKFQAYYELEITGNGDEAT